MAPRRTIVLLATLSASALLAPAPARAQQDTARVDTLAVADTLSADTLRADTVLTPRQRALERLRALPRNPIQGDSVPPDTLLADTLARDTTVAEMVVEPGLPGDPTGEGPPRLRPAGGENVPVDSVRAMLRALAGYSVTEYAGQGAVFAADGDRLELTGESRVVRDENTLTTDSLLVYEGERGVVCGYGAPVLRTRGQAEPVESSLVCFEPGRDLGMARGARTRFTQGATWYVQGADNQVYLLTGRERTQLYGSKTEFTSCDLPHPHYTFQANQLKMVQDELMVARDVTLQFEDVPVFWLPWMVQSMKRDRRSGLLMPQFGVNDIVRNSTGYNRHISNLGFYWAINDYMGAQGTFEWFSGNWTAAQTSLSYRWLRQFLGGQVHIKRYWRESGSRELTVNTGNNWQPDERTRVQLSGNYASSTDFVKQNSFDPRELNRQIVSSGSVNRSFDWGQITLGAQRTQRLSDERIEMKLPSLGLSLSPITLYSGDDGFNVSWSGRSSMERRTLDVNELLPGQRDQSSLSASASHGINLGPFGISQSASYSEQVDAFRPAIPADTVLGTPGDSALAERAAEGLSWSTSVSYQQNLWAGTVLRPNLSINGQQVSDARTGGAFVAAPNRLSAGASMSTSIYGFWPGAGPFSRIRHKIAPNLSWSYSPKPEVTPLQDSIFKVANLQEQNRIQLSFNQTFEAKYEERDTAADQTVEADTAGPTTGEPRRLPQSRKVTLLSINTGTPFVYDFVAADEQGRGFLTDNIRNSLRSDLLRGFQVSMSHDLFAEGDAPEDGGVAPRRFAPFLTDFRTGFSIDDDFWLFRVLGLSGTAPADTLDDQREREGMGTGGNRDPDLSGEADPRGMPGGVGTMVGGRGAEPRSVRRGVGGWQASLDYSMSRFREAERESNQNLRGNLSFRPTQHWSLRWSTSYSFTTSEFSDHVLTLTRDLHRWQANFDFIKAQNGNFALQFRVQLIDNPDLKLDYDQRTDPSSRVPTRVGGQQ